MFKFLLLKSDRNDATSFYVEIIERAIKKLGEDILLVEDPNEINRDDYVLTISVKTFYMACKRHPKRVMNWFQGILPEESWFANIPKLKQVGAFVYYRILERYTLKHSSLNFFVSNTMREHYSRLYGYKRDNFVIMPCFNQMLQENAFGNGKYEKPSFVYTGNLSKWQCFLPMVKLYKDIKKRLPEATLAIYTQDQEQAKRILGEYGVEAFIRYVPYMQLSEEIKQFKYGFILREDVEVNRVATPTKMNSYLSCGIIPIYTDVVGGYKENLSNMKYAVPLAPKTNEGIEKLFNIEEQTVAADDVFMEYKNIFESYYNVENYINLIAKKIKNQIQ